MKPEDMLNEANKHFAAIRAASERKEINWMPGEGPEGAVAYHGFTPGYMIIVIKGPRTPPDGAITTTGAFSVIHLTPEMAEACFEAAHGSTPADVREVCIHCGAKITEEHAILWNSCCDNCIELGRSFDAPADGNPS